MRCIHCNTENGKSTGTCRSCGAPLVPAVMSTPALPVGTRLQGAQYSVGKVLGQGGFGITYLGSDIGLKRAVAIKEFFPQLQGCSRNGTTVQPGGMTTEAKYRDEKNKFLAEGQRLAQFQHLHIVKVFSLFEENNTAYMVMELLKGKTLLRIIEERGPLEEAEAVAYISQIGEALEVIHGSNLLHRDIKPENIIITEESGAVLLDFGTAREFAAGKTRRMTTTLTQGYAPPEQYTQHARFGVSSDVYALGATLYHLLTGEIPMQAMDRALGVELPAPDRLNPKVSSHVSSAVLSAMEVHVDRRPQSVRDFLTALRGFRPTPPIPLNNDPAAPTGAKAGPRSAKKTGCVVINVDRVGYLTIDREVTINVAKAVRPSSDQFQIDKSVTLSRQERSREIELAPGEYRIWATSTMTTKDTLVFGTRLLESNECNLIVPPGNQPVTLTLARLPDGLHLRDDLPAPPSPGQVNRSVTQDTGCLEIQRSKNVSINFPVTIEFESQTLHVINHVIMGKGERGARIELDSGDYILWARVNGTGRGEETTNDIHLTISRVKTVPVRIEVDWTRRKGYMIRRFR
jgi:serine/threonine protein kinase